MKVRCCLCKRLMDFGARKVVGIRYECEQVEYAVCEECFDRLIKEELVDHITIQKEEE